MALETGTYIDALVATNPASTDALSQADDHLRLLKSTLKATFPNVTGAITGTHTAINAKVAEPVSAITSDGSTSSLSSGINAGNVKLLLQVKEPAIVTQGSTPTLYGGTTPEDVRTLIGAAPAATTATLSAVYPVGAIYTSVVATDPSTLFGNTWVAIGSGRVLVGIDASDADFDTVEATGGSKTHTLTIDELPAHTHNFTAMQDTGNSVNRTGGGDLGAPSNIATASTGGDIAHTIVQPFLVVYMWKRTA